jgi:hypothetical protein
MEVFDDTEEDVLELEQANQFELLASKLANQYGLHIKSWVAQGQIQELKESKQRKGVCRAIVDNWLLSYFADDTAARKKRFHEDFSEQKVKHYIEAQAKYDQSVQDNNRRVDSLLFLKDTMGMKVPTKAEDDSLNFMYAEIVRMNPDLVPAVPPSMSGVMTYSVLVNEQALADHKTLATAIHAAVTKTMPSTPPLPGFTDSNQFKRYFRLALKTKGTRYKRAGHAIGLIANFNPYFLKDKQDKKTEYAKAGSVLRWRVMDPNTAEYARIKDKDFVAFFGDLMTGTYPTQFNAGAFELFMASAK